MDFGAFFYSFVSFSHLSSVSLCEQIRGVSELVTNISRDFLTACINIGVEFQSCMISSFGRINDDRL